MTGDNVRRILDLLKNMTRRVPADRFKNWKVGDRIWIRETYIPNLGEETATYKANWNEYPNGSGIRFTCKWRPAMFMPKKYARIWAEITELREEPLLDISYDDILSEGFNIKTDMPTAEGTAGEVTRLWYQQLWGSLNKKRGFDWADNPNVKVIGFKYLP